MPNELVLSPKETEFDYYPRTIEESMSWLAALDGITSIMKETTSNLAWGFTPDHWLRFEHMSSNAMDQWNLLPFHKTKQSTLMDFYGVRCNMDKFWKEEFAPLYEKYTEKKFYDGYADDMSVVIDNYLNIAILIPRPSETRKGTLFPWLCGFKWFSYREKKKELGHTGDYEPMVFNALMADVTAERDFALNAFRQYKNALNNYFKTLETINSGFNFRP